MLWQLHDQEVRARERSRMVVEMDLNVVGPHLTVAVDVDLQELDSAALILDPRLRLTSAEPVRSDEVDRARKAHAACELEAVLTSIEVVDRVAKANR